MAEQKWVELPVDGAPMRAHVSLPREGTAIHAGVVIIHGGWGFEGTLLNFPKRLAFSGYAAIVPDMYHRETPEQSEQKPLERIARLTWAGAKRDIQVALDWLIRDAHVEADRTAIVGYCMGGALALMGAASLPFHTGVLFYPHEVFGPFGADKVVPSDLLPQLKNPLLGHFGADDKNPSPADMQKLDELLTAQGTPHQFYQYEGAGHGFAVHSPPRESYRQIASNTSYDRTIGWFDRHLRNVAAPV